MTVISSQKDAENLTLTIVAEFDGTFRQFSAMPNDDLVRIEQA